MWAGFTFSKKQQWLRALCCCSAAVAAADDDDDAVVNFQALELHGGTAMSILRCQQSDVQLLRLQDSVSTHTSDSCCV